MDPVEQELQRSAPGSLLQQRHVSRPAYYNVGIGRFLERKVRDCLLLSLPNDNYAFT